MKVAGSQAAHIDRHEPSGRDMVQQDSTLVVLYLPQFMVVLLDTCPSCDS